MQKLIIGLSTTSLKYLRTMDNTPYNAGWLALGRASLSFLLGLAYLFWGPRNHDWLFWTIPCSHGKGVLWWSRKLISSFSFVHAEIYSLRIVRNWNENKIITMHISIVFWVDQRDIRLFRMAMLEQDVNKETSNSWSSFNFNKLLDLYVCTQALDLLKYWKKVR